MKQHPISPLLVALGFFAVLLGVERPGRSEPPIPAAWLAAWSQPPSADRPLQIIHGVDSKGALPEGIHQVLREKGPAAITPDAMQQYKARGLGGVVANVAFRGYLGSEANWKNLTKAVEAFAKLGMVVWIYDEEGYPSGSAGGLVVRENRDFQASELAFDASRSDPFVVRPAYEYTHASNNYYAARRYVNLLDDRAIGCFLAKTHEAYWKRLGSYFGSTVQATFTDEPSLIAINLGQIPESVRKKVPIIDPIDPSIRPLPVVPWCYDLPARFQERFGRDLLPQRRSLFAGNTAEDRGVRRQFWSLVADLVAERYFGAIQRWCAAHHIASSGHSLWEEEALHHVAIEGNGLKALGRMDIPGEDVLTSDPETVLYAGWMTAAMPSSAAVLHGHRRVMTETSDFAQIQSGQGPAGLPEMQATAAWQAAWGVTDFSLYYSLAQRSIGQYRAYCDYVGRLNAVLKPAQLSSRVLLYYPIYDLWSEYLPVAEPLRLESQSRRAQRLVQSLMHLGQTLQRAQIPFVLIDHENLSRAAVQAGGKLAIHGHCFDAILLPEGVELPRAAADVVEKARHVGFRVLSGPWDESKVTCRSLVDALRPQHQIAPASPAIALGEFVRDGRSILLTVNVGRQPYEGHFTAAGTAGWQRMDPADGSVRPAEVSSPGRIRLSLAPRQALLWVKNPR